MLSSEGQDLKWENLHVPNIHYFECLIRDRKKALQPADV